MIYKLHSGVQEQPLRRVLGRGWIVWLFVWFTAIVALLLMVFDYQLIIAGRS